jgi:hypothetical protein
MKLADFLSIAILLIIGTAGILFAINAKAGNEIEISTPNGNYRYSLSKDRDITVMGKTSQYDIEIRDGKVRALHAGCPNQYCTRKGWTYRIGDSIICVPEEVIIRVTGESEDYIDAITQ